MWIDKGAEDGIHAGEVALAARLGLLANIRIEAYTHRGLARWHDDAGGLPELRAKGLGPGGIGAGGIFAALMNSLDLAKGVSQESRFFAHSGSLSGH